MRQYHLLPLELLTPHLSGGAPAVFLDTARCDPDNHHSYLFLRPRRILTAHTFTEVPVVLDRIRELSSSAWIAGFLSYEAGYALDSAFARECASARVMRGVPLAWFGVFDPPHVFDHAAGSWNRPLPRVNRSSNPAREPAAPPPVVTRGIRWPRYSEAVRTIRRRIAAGDTYQINYTYACGVRSPAAAWDLYRGVRTAQEAGYCAFVNTGSARVLSFSPELFFALERGTIRVRPMKGTAPRGRTPSLDRMAASRLATDPKNRAENLMIVDLLRNDLGRVCATGSIAVTRMFEVETHLTLHQMTTTVTGRVAAGITIADIIRCLFPCGSVTGAPKINSMKIIRALETRPRGVYCGALGFISPEGAARFSVPIRTLQRTGEGDRWVYRTGSGIVWDSRAAQEWRECILKTSFLTRRTPSYQIVESLLWNGRLVYLKEHARRMRLSCGKLGFPFSTAEFAGVAKRICASMPDSGKRKVRIVCGASGTFDWEVEPLAPGGGHTPVARMARLPVSSAEPLLHHKTTRRPWYDSAMRRIREGDCYDIIFVNEKGHVTEGARTNVFARINGVLYTPPVSCGLLPGVLRERLLKRGACRERLLTPGDLRAAEEVYCGNSVRGMVRVRVKGRTPRFRPA